MTCLPASMDFICVPRRPGYALMIASRSAAVRSSDVPGGGSLSCADGVVAPTRRITAQSTLIRIVLLLRSMFQSSRSLADDRGCEAWRTSATRRYHAAHVTAFGEGRFRSEPGGHLYVPEVD